MNLKEFVDLNKIPISKLGGYKFTTNITGEVEITPHEDMNRSYTIFLKRPFVNSGIRQICNFKFGKNLRFEDDNEETKKWANKFLKARPWLKKELKKYLIMREVCGNVYLQQAKDVEGKFNGFLTFPDSSRVYLNTEFTDENKDYWVVQVPEGIKTINGRSPKYYKINYIFGSALWQKTVYGIGYGKNYFEHDKTGMSIDGLYGRSYLASTNDDEETLMQILKNIAVIAKYRAMNNKIIYPAGEDEVLIEDDKEQLKNDLLMLEDGEHLIINRKVEINSMNNQGEYDTMTGETEFLRKDMQSGLTPNYGTPWASEINRNTASEAKIPFQVDIENDREEIFEFLTNIFKKYFSINYPEVFKNSRNFKITSDFISLDGKDDLMNWSTMLYNTGLITFNEARSMYGDETVEGGDKYNWEIQQQPNTLMDQNPEYPTEAFKEGASELTLSNFLKLYSGKYGVGQCREAANKVVERVAGYKIVHLTYEPGVGEPLLSGQHYVAESMDGKTIIDLTFPAFAQRLIYGRRANDWIKKNKSKVTFPKREYMKNVYIEV